MNKFRGALVGAALVLPFAIGTATAGPMDSDTKIACSEVKYSSEFLSKYPDAPAACVEAVEKDGKRYAKFRARVYLNSEDRTTVELLNVRGDRLSTFSFKPSAGASVDVGGKKIKFQDLRPGEKISFWVSADRLAASEQPGSTEDSWAVLPPQNYGGTDASTGARRVSAGPRFLFNVSAFAWMTGGKLVAIYSPNR